MGKRFYADDSVERAVLKASRELSIAPEELAYKKVDKKHGFLKGRKRVVIEVDEESFRRVEAEGPPVAEAGLDSEPPVAVSEPEAEVEETSVEESGDAGDLVASIWDQAESQEAQTAEADERAESDAPGEAESRDEGDLVELPAQPARATDRFPIAEGTLADAARKALEELFQLADLELESQVLQGEDRLEIELSGPGQERLLEDRGRLLLSIQHLVPRLMRGIAGESSACRVDCDNFQEVRAEKLRDTAQRAASEVALKGRARTLEPMSPDERRIVHLTLADDATVETVSKGEGLFKRVTVRPAGRKPRGFDPYGR